MKKPIDKESGLVLYNYKEPLRKVRNGHGYMGALLLSQETGQMQCHICGKLFDVLSIHVFGSHKMTTRDYKEKFGLAYKTALISEKIREERKQTTLNWISRMSVEEKEAYKQKLKAQGKRGFLKRKSGQPSLTLETKNKRGVCPDQLVEKIKEIKNILGHTPSKNEFIVACGTQKYIHLIYKTFGSWTQGLKMAHLVPKKRSRDYGKGQRFYTDEELLEYLRNFAMEERKVPTTTDSRRGMIPETSLYVRHFGSLENARREAGVYEFVDPLIPNENKKKSFIANASY